MWRRAGIAIVTMLLTCTFGTVATGAPRGETRAQLDRRCFPETNFCIAGRIREFWEQNGGLPVFGFPVGEQRAEVIEGKTYQAQWFERNRLELHPDNARPYDVLLGRNGADRLIQQGRDWMQFPGSGPRGDCRFFPETNHNVCGAILASWHANGLEFDGSGGKSEAENLALYGLPLSDERVEVIEGKEYTVQWFERARFELHPENAPPYNVLLGLLGNEIRQAGAAPPPAAPAPQPPAPAPPQEDLLSFTDVPADGNVNDDVDAGVRIAGAKRLVRDNNVVTKVVVGDRFSIRVKTRMKNAEKQEDGADIKSVTFQVDGGDVYQQTERNAAYCMFGGGDDGSEQSCNVWVFSDHGDRWPNDGEEVDTSGSYNIEITVRDRDDNQVANWNFKLEVRP